MNVVAQYWLGTPDPFVIIIFETDSKTSMMQFQGDWKYYFAITIVPAITAEEGMEMAKQMMG